jgi:hypothetical protein
MTTLRIAHDTRHLATSRKDTTLSHIELRLAEIGERHALLRSHRDGDRHASGRSWSLRRSLGGSIIRIGRRIGGDSVTTPAWQG